MNIFFLSINPKECAQMHCDKHVVKMILEVCQMLWTAWHLTGFEGWEESVSSGVKIYRKTHVNHPMNVWVRSSPFNYEWTVQLAYELCKEYTHRYDKIHASQKGVEWLMKNTPKCDSKEETKSMYATDELPDKCTHIPLCMPDEYKFPSVVEAYRLYYIGDKSRFAKWRKRNTPVWFSPFSETVH